MVQVQLRYNGEGVWRPLLLPVSVLAAQTIASAAKQLNLADQIAVAPALGRGQIVDLTA